ncbi:MAG: hypothetical protein KKF46_02205 [Nanoarchaeota archaeon]|nr:hypothetical protein [Nanoarchaeota archaeon]MBU1321147.1 hypothetical protein [Nanoarchaeota archaeon]MBU1597901.1 hypothetical protein [Nanoarchaeota archaeon]MBU2441616.1 hypothetical protein [Nanoarchaeota archaeon]
MRYKKNNSKNKNVLSVFEYLFWIYVILGSAVIVYFIILKLTGHSPTTDTIILTMLSVILAGLLGGSITVGTHIGKVNEFMKNSDRRFAALARDFKEHLKENK